MTWVRRTPVREATAEKVRSRVDLGRVRSITAAVGDGPHSPLTVAAAARLARALGVPAEVATVYRNHDELPQAMERVSRLAAPHPELGRRATHEPHPSGLIYGLPTSALLVVGPPDGSWFDRQIHGSGQRLLDAAPGGAIVVRTAERRASRSAVDATAAAVSPRQRMIPRESPSAGNLLEKIA